MSIESLYEKSISCLYCQQTFKTLKMKRSKIRIKAKDTDFCTYYIGENPLYYDVNVCPNCGFAFTEGFSPINLLRKSHFEEQYVKKIEIPQLCGERNIHDAVRSYKLALLSASMLGEKRIVMANICMRLAWLHRYLNNNLEEKRFLSHALQFYEDIYQMERMDRIPMEEEKLIYLVGELNGRLGNYEKTRKWFSYIFTSRNLQPKWKSIARERWLDYRNSRSEITQNPEGFDDTSKI